MKALVFDTFGDAEIHQESSRLLCLMNGEDLGCHTYAYRLRGELAPMIGPHRGYLSRRGHDRLYQEGDKTCGHERSCLDQVEVEPRLAEKCEAKLSINHPSDQPRDCKIGSRVDAGGEYPG